MGGRGGGGVGGVVVTRNAFCGYDSRYFLALKGSCQHIVLAYDTLKDIKITQTVVILI